MRAVTFIQMHPSLRKNDRRRADFRKHETAQVTFDQRARQSPHLGVWDDAIAAPDSRLTEQDQRNRRTGK